jgi:hypothetical protein
LENFDEQVQERLKVAQADATQALDRMERLLMRLTRGMLAEHAEFDDTGNGFTLHSRPPTADLDAHPTLTPAALPGNTTPEPIPLGRYELPRVREDAHVYRLQHPLAQTLLANAKRAPLVPARLDLDYAAYGAKVSVIEALRGGSGVCAVQRLRVTALGATEEFLLLAATFGSEVLDAEVTDRLLSIPGTFTSLPRLDETPEGQGDAVTGPKPQQVGLDFAAAYLPLPLPLTAELARQRAAVVAGLEARNLSFFSSETEKLDAWADDQRAALEHQIKELDRRIRETRTRGKGAATLAEKLDAQREQRDLESQRDRYRRELFARQDEVQQRRDRIVDELEGQLRQEAIVTDLVSVAWELR